MYPIQMQVGNRGMGMGYDQFVKTFNSVCLEHKKCGRARAFAFLFYDMTHGVVREALKNAYGFQRLHDKTAKDVTLFYLHANAVSSHWQNFNRGFMEALGIEDQAQTPCMVFFNVTGENIEDVSIYAIDEKSTDPVLTVAELEQYVDEAINKLNAEGNFSALTSIGKSLASFGSLIRLTEFLLKLKGTA
ncbi:hypothetical protein NDQ41_01995 [Alcaligenes faecalis]|uniref:hypothetical protein n=2 Tax=Alcaligenes faecalis TaxID=511 RepID=UPI00204027D6|nr:hypothetical protein [Alcaligenes faecalis]MCM2620384.1 hypothetical protein [Alcaligenes faecalis]